MVYDKVNNLQIPMKMDVDIHSPQLNESSCFQLYHFTVL